MLTPVLQRLWSGPQARKQCLRDLVVMSRRVCGCAGSARPRGYAGGPGRAVGPECAGDQQPGTREPEAIPQIAPPGDGRCADRDSSLERTVPSASVQPQRQPPSDNAVNGPGGWHGRLTPRGGHGRRGLAAGTDAASPDGGHGRPAEAAPLADRVRPGLSWLAGSEV